MSARAQQLDDMRDEYERRLLARIIWIAEQALAPPPQVTVPLETLCELGVRINRLPDNGLIGDETVMLLQCLINAARRQADGAEAATVRWRTLAKCFLPFVRTDLACAQAARGNARMG